MAIFLDTLEELMTNAGMEVLVLRKYVDDILGVTRKLELGSRYNKVDNLITVTQEAREEDEAMGRSQEEVTLECLKAMANCVFDFLEFTGECSVGEAAIPCLDMEVLVGRPTCDGPWWSNQREETPGDQKIPGIHPTTKEPQVLYRFYKKPMAATLTMLSRTALSSQCKVSTATSEIIKRINRTSTLFTGLVLLRVMVYRPHVTLIALMVLF